MDAVKYRSEGHTELSQEEFIKNIGPFFSAVNGILAVCAGDKETPIALVVDINSEGKFTIGVEVAPTK
jgi:hypothetical protein